MAKPRINIHVSEKAAALLDQAAALPGATKTSIVDAAILKLLAPRCDDREHAALIKRLDRMTRHMERLADDAAAQSETLALYILYYLCITPPLPETSRVAAEALGRKRFEHFISQVGDRLMGKERYADALLAAMGLERADGAPSSPAPVANGRALEAVQ